jgi:hypothetical protein
VPMPPAAVLQPRPPQPPPFTPALTIPVPGGEAAAVPDAPAPSCEPLEHAKRASAETAKNGWRLRPCIVC